MRTHRRSTLAMRLADDRFMDLVVRLLNVVSVGGPIEVDANIFDYQADALVIVATEVMYSCAPLAVRWKAAKCLAALGAIRENRKISELVRASDIAETIAAYQQA